MTEKTFTFTIEQLKDIFRAGISRGAEEEASFQSGSRATGWQFDGLVHEVYNIINEGKRWGDKGHHDIFEVDKWFREQK